jgi:amino acid adenylation domain-containing protein
VSEGSAPVNARHAQLPAKRPLDDLESRVFEGFSGEDLCGSIWTRFERVAERWAERPALIDGDRSTSYRELRQLAEGYAGRMAARAADEARPAPIALITGDGLQRIAGMLAALRSGRPFVPIDRSSPSGRIQLMLRDSGAAAVVTDTPDHPALRLFAGEIIEAPRPFPGSSGETGTPAASGDPALVLYTSGTTGRPKCVVQRHGMILDSLSCYSQALRISVDDRLSLLASPGFGEAWNDVFLALLNGAALCVREVKTQGVRGLAHWLADAEVTVLHCVPTLLRTLTADLPPGVLAPRLRIVNLGGETVSRTDVQRCFERLNRDCVVVNSYGSTETKLIAQYFVDRYTELASESVPVGHPRRGVEIRVLSEEGTPVPRGEVGEIEVSSGSVVRGYDGQRTESANRFEQADSARMRYRTGDLGRINGQGLLEHLGRRDQMVKLRGYRIELAEIECLLQSHPDVQQAVVLVSEMSAGFQQLVAVYQSRNEFESAEVEFGGLLADRLPDYMLPSRYFRVSEFPLTDSGKPDRRRLLEQVVALRESTRTARAGSVDAGRLGEQQHKLLRIVGEVLHLDEVPLDAGFVELGGDSLNVTQLLLRVAAELNREVPAEVVFQSRTLRELAQTILPAGGSPQDD